MFDILDNLPEDELIFLNENKELSDHFYNMIINIKNNNESKNGNNSYNQIIRIRQYNRNEYLEKITEESTVIQSSILQSKQLEKAASH